MTYKIATRFCTQCGQCIEGFVGWIIYDATISENKNRENKNREDKGIETKYCHAICPPRTTAPLEVAKDTSDFIPAVRSLVLA